MSEDVVSGAPMPRGPSVAQAECPPARAEGVGAGEEARDRLAIALDVGDLDAALAMARTVAPWFGVAKVGYELYGEAGPVAFARLRDLGFTVFCDLKLHDIPTTVQRGAAALARHGVGLMNAHAAGGADMLRAFVAGAHEGAEAAGVEPPVTLAVTVLTSDPDPSRFDERLALARDTGCDGVVCSGLELDRVRAVGLRAIVPGVRPAGAAVDDQARIVTPGEAIARGADWIVVGRAVTRADDPATAAAAVAAEAADAMASSH